MFSISSYLRLFDVMHSFFFSRYIFKVDLRQMVWIHLVYGRAPFLSSISFAISVCSSATTTFTNPFLPFPHTTHLSWSSMSSSEHCWHLRSPLILKFVTSSRHLGWNGRLHYWHLRIASGLYFDVFEQTKHVSLFGAASYPSGLAGLDNSDIIQSSY